MNVGSVVSVRHLPHGTATELRGTTKVLSTDRIIIPARNEATKIGPTIGYLIELGIPAEQIIVMVNHTTDNTAEVAGRFGVIVFDQDEILTSEMKVRLEEEYGVAPTRLRGKGTAMFAAMLKLEQLGTPDDARVFFLDADIKNVSDVGVISLLLAGWEAWNGDVRIVKLASQGRNNEGILAFLGLPHVPYMPIGALQWVLCGQMALRWRDLRIMRGATKYAIEMAMLMDLWDRHQTPAVFGEVAIGVPLEDKRNTDHDHTVMYRGILAFVAQLLQRGGWKKLPALTRQEVADMNVASGRPNPFFTPPVEGVGPSALEECPLDAILPSVEEFGRKP